MPVHLESAIEIPQPPARVFAVLDDIARIPEWFSRCAKAEKLEPGANAVGTRLRYTIRQRGDMTTTMEGSIVVYATDHHIAFRMSDQVSEVTIDLELSPTTTGTRLVHRIDVVPRSFVGKLLQSVIRWSLPSQIATDMAKLRALAIV